MKTKRKFGKQAAVITAAAALLLAGCAAPAVSTGSAAGTASEKPASLPAVYVGDDTIGVTQNVISTSGEGKVFVTPDQAELVFGIISQGADAKTAKDQNLADYNKVIDFLKQQGFDDTSIQTSQLGLEPVYDWSSNTRALSGYSMETDITVSDIKLDQLGGLIDSAVNSGINSIQSVTYSSSVFDTKYQEALTAAVADAKAKAEALAKAGNVQLGQVVNMTEYGADTSARYARSNMTAGTGATAATADAANAMALQPGQLEVTANLNVVFAIQ